MLPTTENLPQQDSNNNISTPGVSSSGSAAPSEARHHTLFMPYADVTYSNSSKVSSAPAVIMSRAMSGDIAATTVPHSIGHPTMLAFPSARSLSSTQPMDFRHAARHQLSLSRSPSPPLKSDHLSGDEQPDGLRNGHDFPRGASPLDKWDDRFSPDSIPDTVGDFALHKTDPSSPTNSALKGNYIFF